MNAPAPHASPLIDPFGRQIAYVRVSVTDRCDFRCVYCMSEDMNFLPKRDVLSLEELDRLCSAFVGLGARKIRITGGEPLVRRNVMSLFRGLRRHLDSGALDEVDGDDQRIAARALRPRARRLRRPADQRLARHARPGQVPRRDALGRSRRGAQGHRRRGRGGPQDQDQRGRAQGLQRPARRARWSTGRTGAAST